MGCIMMWDIRIGKTRHFKPDNRNVSACGIVNPGLAAYDARDCDCNRCRKTKKYKAYMKSEFGVKIK